MSNPNEHKSREVHQDSYTDANGHNHTHVTRTDETVNNIPPDAHSAGYVEGRVDENRYQGEVLAERDNENAGRGLITGILLTSLAALTAGAIWYLNQRNAVAPVQTIVVPNSQQAPSPSPEAKQETTIIERTRDVPVPVVVPQQQAPAAAPQAPAPDIKIDNSVTQPPATQEARATQPAPTQSESQSSTDQSTQSNTDSPTPAEGTSSQPDTTSGSSSPTGTDGAAQ